MTDSISVSPGMMMLGSVTGKTGDGCQQKQMCAAKLSPDANGSHSQKPQLNLAHDVEFAVFSFIT